ncbi:MAG TPA: DUF4129 domain-containing protein [Nocardioidaceae bacterium]
MRRDPLWLSGIAGAAIVLAAWATTTTFVPALRGAVPPGNHGAHQAAQVHDRAHPPNQTPPDRDPGSLPLAFEIAFYVLLVLFAAGLLLIVVHRVRWRRLRRRTSTFETDIDAVADDIDAQLPELLRRSATQSLAELAEGSPRNAIVRCWLQLEDAVVSLGLRRDPASTSEEFTATVLARFAVGRRSIDELGVLYREARFSEHDLDETHRRRAVRALMALRDDLDVAAAEAAAPRRPSGIDA